MPFSQYVNVAQYIKTLQISTETPHDWLRFSLDFDLLFSREGEGETKFIN